MKNMIPIVVIILVAFIVIFSVKNKGGMNNMSASNNGYQHLSMDEAAELMKNESEYILLDVRTKEEYEAKHIPGAILVPNETIGSNDIPELPDKEQKILVYCRSGNRSKQAAKKLSALGYTNIIEIGGIINWKGDTVSGK